MIVGTGIDAVEIQRIENLISTWGDRFLDRFFHPDEIRDCRKKRNPAPSVAARFAAKEAFFKAIGTGILNGFALRDVSVSKNSSGAPHLVIHSQNLRTHLKKMGDPRICLSLTHEGGLAFAQVILDQN